MLCALAVGHCYHPDAGIAARLLDRAEPLAEQTGDPDVLAEDLTAARGVAERTGGAPTLLRCRLLKCELTESATERVAAARALASDAAAVGMAGVARAAEALG